MKKFSSTYFEKKYKTIFQNLLAKEGFKDEVKEVRRKLKMPKKGFTNEQELAHFLIKKMGSVTIYAMTESHILERRRGVRKFGKLSQDLVWHFP